MDVSRQELFEQVWSKPLTELAKAYGVSDVAIAKACRKHDIPLPGLGFWAKAAAGKAPPRPGLRTSAITTISIGAGAPRLPMGNPKMIPEAADIPELAELAVPAALGDKVAPLTRRTQKQLQRKPEEGGFARCHAPDGFDIQASIEQADRALRIMDTVATGLLRLNIPIQINEEKRKVQAVVGNEFVTIKLSERYSRVELPAPPRNPRARYEPWQPTRYRYDFTGELVFTIDEHFDGGRKSWADGTRSRLEQKVADIVRGILMAGELLRARTEYWEEQRRKRATEQAIREERARQREEEKRAVEALSTEAAHWNTACTVMSYLQHLESRIADQALNLNISAQGRKWLDESRDRALRMDPTARRLSTLVENGSSN